MKIVSENVKTDLIFPIRIGKTESWPFPTYSLVKFCRGIKKKNENRKQLLLKFSF